MNDYRDRSRSVSDRVSSLLAHMTAAEKIAQISGAWIYELQSEGQLDPQKMKGRLEHGVGQISRLASGSTLNPLQAAQTANQLQSFLVQHTRLGIPAILHEECCAGSMTLGASIFPQPIGLASTFRPDLAEKMTAEIRRQLRACGVHQGLAPVLDVARDPRWGRVEETFGEDPLLVSQFGMSYIRGLQGPDLKEGIMATGKHFVGHSLSQGGLNCAPVQLGRRTLWDIYLMPFQAAIQQAGLAAMMNAYPELDGEVVAASRAILTGLLRDQLGFNGLVVSDYEAIAMIHTYHQVAANLAEAAILALNAGIDVELPTAKCYSQELIQALDSGALSLELLDTAVARHLQKKFELGLFETPYVDEGHVLEVYETPAQRQMALDIARQSLVLLTNNGILPLSRSIGRLAVIGPNADSGRNLCGDYSYAAGLESLIAQKPAGAEFDQLDLAQLAAQQVKIPTVQEAIRAKLTRTRVLYARGCDIRSQDTTGFAEAVQTASAVDAVVLVLGDKSGLTLDCTCGEARDSDDIQLPGVQADLAKAVQAAGKPVVVVLINGRPLAIPELAAAAAAILEAWIPGEEGGAAIADVRFGDVPPGGKLPITCPRSVGQVPIFYNHQPSAQHSNWHTDYVSESIKPLFPFGHGLSYARFDYKDLAITPARAAAGETITIACTVENASRLAGDEVVQLYCQDVYASSARPVKELKGFARLSIPAGGSRRVTFSLPVNILAFYNQDNQLVVEPGKINLMVGSSSTDIRLQGDFEISGPGPQEVKERVFECPVRVEA